MKERRNTMIELERELADELALDPRMRNLIDQLDAWSIEPPRPMNAAAERRRMLEAIVAPPERAGAGLRALVRGRRAFVLALVIALACAPLGVAATDSTAGQALRDLGRHAGLPTGWLAPASGARAGLHQRSHIDTADAAVHRPVARPTAPDSDLGAVNPTPSRERGTTDVSRREDTLAAPETSTPESDDTPTNTDEDVAQEHDAAGGAQVVERDSDPVDDDTPGVIEQDEAPVVEPEVIVDHEAPVEDSALVVDVDGDDAGHPQTE